MQIDMASGQKNITAGFEENYSRYYKRCVLFAKSYVCDFSAAESIASEAMSVYWERRAAGEQFEMTLPFLFSVIRNKALRYLKNEDMRLKAQGEAGTVIFEELTYRIRTLESCDPHVIYEKDVQTILHDTLGSLDRKTGRIFSLSRFDGMTNREIAMELGISEKTVEYHISKALKVLRVALKDYLPLVGIFLGL